MSNQRRLVADLYLEHYGELSRFLTRHVGCRELAADLLHELFLRLLAREAPMDIRHRRGYLFRSARNLATEAAASPHWRDSARLHRYAETQESEDSLSPERQASAKQTLARLLDVVKRLSPRCRDAFILHKFEGLTYAEVAKHMGISVGQVEKHMMRALDACRAATRECTLPR